MRKFIYNTFINLDFNAFIIWAKIVLAYNSLLNSSLISKFKDIIYLILEFLRFIKPMLFNLLIFSLILWAYFYYFDPLQVHFCIDGIQECIEVLRNKISLVQREIALHARDLNSGVLSEAETSRIASEKAFLEGQRRHMMGYLSQLREIQDNTWNHEVVIEERDS